MENIETKNIPEKNREYYVKNYVKDCRCTQTQTQVSSKRMILQGFGLNDDLKNRRDKSNKTFP